MSMKCFAQNTKQITHSRHASYPSISLRFKSADLGYKALIKKEGAELMRDPAAV